jgi:hypothetical protein
MVVDDLVAAEFFVELAEDRLTDPIRERWRLRRVGGRLPRSGG